MSFPLGGVADIRGSVERAEKGGLLEPRELTACAQTLFAFSRTREVLARKRRDGAAAGLRGPATARSRKARGAHRPVLRGRRGDLRAGQPGPQGSPGSHPGTAPGHQVTAGRNAPRRALPAIPARELLHPPEQPVRGAGAGPGTGGGARHRPQREPVRTDALRRARVAGGHRQRPGHRPVGGPGGGAPGPPGALGRGGPGRRHASWQGSTRPRSSTRPRPQLSSERTWTPRPRWSRTRTGRWRCSSSGTRCWSCAVARWWRTTSGWRVKFGRWSSPAPTPAARR